MSPTACSDTTAGATSVPGTGMVGEGCTRGGVSGVGSWVGGWEGYTGTQPQPSQGPIFSIFKVKGPTYGQMKAILEVSMRFLR